MRLRELHFNGFVPASRCRYAEMEILSLMPAGPCFAYNKDDQWMVLSPGIVVEKARPAQASKRVSGKTGKKSWKVLRMFRGIQT
eukprot:gnl/Chilomastix_caulleri/4043.p3 GENE.gnl/Chilomastix_caulleri/4043~~gnl/Chilomastix_caulleri/4043.p3  ORF type:complete len:84 (+),score=8.89 gnl/Chilomastix_caulleri/4043:272-523(+)